jgi:hypothetical protein
MTRESQSKVMAEVVFPVQKPAYKANYRSFLKLLKRSKIIRDG